MIHFLLISASLSPLLTAAHLWQVKEWRIDRMREHLRREGYVRQLFGLSRPAVLALCAVLALLSREEELFWPGTPLILLTALTGLQLATGKQPMPVWTQKAITLIGTSLILTAILPWVISDAFLPVIPLLQSVVLLIAWLVFRPVDAVLKNRIMRKAKQLREAHPEMIVIGITGSVGKTTTKELLAHILQERNILVTPAHINTEMGVSKWLIQTLQEKAQTPEILIVEMGAYRMGEIALLCDIVRPTIGIITYIGKQHVGLFGSQEALCQAKGELVEALPEDGLAIVNGDNTLCIDLKDRCSCPFLTVGTGGKLDLEAFDIEETPSGLKFRVEETMYDVPLHGTHNITNLLLSIATAKHIGEKDAVIAKHLRSFTLPHRTFTVRKESGVTILDDTYNASPESFQAAINWAKEQPIEHKILLTNGLIELGEEEDRIHAELGALASLVFERVIFLDANSSKAFAKGYGKCAEQFSQKTEKVPVESLLVCIGRMPPSKITSLLP